MIFSAMFGADSFSQSCLLATRLVEAGVRFVTVNLGGWDTHTNNFNTLKTTNLPTLDSGLSGLLLALEAKGLLGTTTVFVTGEFGRTPFAQGSNGRDHNPFGFTVWMAGGGVKGGMTFGETDEFGYYAVEGRLELHDLHATMLHLLGIDHTRLTYRFGGRDMRLTDVFGNVVHDIVA